jgi:DNA-binding MarR family transcriptional regulator
MSDNPTERQLAVLAFVADYAKREDCPPTLREIGEHLSVPWTNAVSNHLDALERKGYLVRRAPAANAKSRPSRAIRLTPKGRKYLKQQRRPTSKDE